MNYIKLFYGFLAFCLITLSAYEIEGNTEYKCVTKYDAIKIALEYTGFADAKGYTPDTASIKAKMINYDDKDIPYLYKGLKGKKVCQICFNGILMNIEGKEDSIINKYPNDFIIYIDAESGSFLMAKTSPDPIFSKNKTFSSIEKAEEYLGNQFEVYTGFIDTAPAISLYDAINSYNDILKTKEVMAILVMNSMQRRDPILTWVIFCEEPPSIPMDYDHRYRLQGEFVRHLKIVMDANTGTKILQSRRTSKLE